MPVCQRSGSKLDHSDATLDAEQCSTGVEFTGHKRQAYNCIRTIEMHWNCTDCENVAQKGLYMFVSTLLSSKGHALLCTKSQNKTTDVVLGTQSDCQRCNRLAGNVSTLSLFQPRLWLRQEAQHMHSVNRTQGMLQPMSSQRLLNEACNKLQAIPGSLLSGCLGIASFPCDRTTRRKH